MNGAPTEESSSREHARAPSSSRGRSPEGTDLVRDQRAVTARALLVGVLAVVALSLVSIHCTLAGVGSLVSWDFVLETAVFLLVAVMALNRLVGVLWPRAMLGRGELAVVFLMLLAAAPVPTIGFLSKLIPALGGIRYYATAQNEWSTSLLPHVASRVLPGDPNAVRLLFEGLPTRPMYGSTPGAWAVTWVKTLAPVWWKPLAFWGAFFVAVSVACLCLAVIMRKQWIERERLSYPIMGLALALLDTTRAPGERPFWKRRMLWAGFALAFGMSSLHPLSAYLEEVVGWRFVPPRLNYYWRSPGRAYLLRFKFSWAIMGLTYLIPQDVSLTVWLFNLIFQLQYYTYRLMGFDIRPMPERVWGGPMLSGQAVGAFLFLGASTVWLARRHIADVWRAARSWSKDADDSREILPYRWTCWVFIAMCLVLVGMIHAMGTPLYLAVVVLAGALCFFLAITKIAIQCGLGWIMEPIPLSCLVANTLGTNWMAQSSVTSLGTNWMWTEPMRITEMGTMSHGLKVADQLRVRRRGLFLAVLLGVVVALVAGSLFQLYLAYDQGGVNFYRWFYLHYASRPWQFVEGRMTSPSGPRWGETAFIALGAAMAGAMQAGRHYLAWWPFSVVGYAGAFLPTTRKYWFSMFLVWLIKGRLLNYGGLRAYRLVRPLFLGLLLGHATACGLWYLVALATGTSYGGVPW